MRWLLVFLLLLNGFYFSWNVWLAKPLEVPVGVQASELELLVAPMDVREECFYVWGEPLAALEQRIRALNVIYRSETSMVDGASDYWVYLPSLPRGAATQRLLRELHSKNIESYLIVDGEIKGGISLGVFAREDSARAVQNRLAQAGYEPRIQRQVHETRNREMLVIPKWKSPWIGEKEWQQLLGELSTVQYEKKSCTGLF